MLCTHCGISSPANTTFSCLLMRWFIHFLCSNIWLSFFNHHTVHSSYVCQKLHCLSVALIKLMAEKPNAILHNYIQYLFHPGSNVLPIDNSYTLSFVCNNLVKFGIHIKNGLWFLSYFLQPSIHLPCSIHREFHTLTTSNNSGWRNHRGG